MCKSHAEFVAAPAGGALTKKTSSFHASGACRNKLRYPSSVRQRICNFVLELCNKQDDKINLNIES